MPRRPELLNKGKAAPAPPRAGGFVLQACGAQFGVGGGQRACFSSATTAKDFSRRIEFCRDDVFL